MQDTPINPPQQTSKWDLMLESAEIFEVTKLARELGYGTKVALTNQLFGLLYPFAEDEVKEKGLFENRVEELLKLGQRAPSSSAKTPVREFEINIHTYVKAVHAVDNINDPEQRYECETYKHPIIKRVHAFAAMVPDNDKQPALLFGVRGVK